MSTSRAVVNTSLTTDSQQMVQIAAHHTADQRFDNKSQVMAGSSNQNFTAFPSGGPT
jgi:hypothetical protein